MYYTGGFVLLLIEELSSLSDDGLRNGLLLHQVANEDGVDERLSDAAPLTGGKQCKIRPVHIFLGVACCMTLCGFVLTVYGGVKIYYHDVFKANS